jgi:hypothetical protein
MLSVYTPFTFNFPCIVKFYDKRRPESKLRSVVFPDPDGPKIAVKVFG